MQRLATVELQLVMQCLDLRSLTLLARCSRFTIRSATDPFAWKVPVLQRWAPGLSGHVNTPLLRCAQFNLWWDVDHWQTGSLDNEAAQIVRVPHLHTLRICSERLTVALRILDKRW